MSSGGAESTQTRLEELCAAFKLPTIREELVERLSSAGHEKALGALLEIFELEAADRAERRCDRLRRASKLPLGKTIETLEQERLPTKLARQVQSLCKGEFVDTCENVLAFGPPGAGKSHVVAAIGHALVERGRSVLFVPAFRLVQELLAAKRDLDLPRALRKLDRFDVLIVDDLGYVQHSADDAEVLFTLMAERYERRSMVITSNLVFSQWDQIFQNPMATAAAIDRIVHHATILELDVPSYRSEKAKSKKGSKA